MANKLTPQEEEARDQFITGLYTKINMLEASLRVAEEDLKEGRRLSRILLDKLNAVWKNDQYLNAFILYQTHFGDYLANGGAQVTHEQDDLEEWAAGVGESRNKK